MYSDSKRSSYMIAAIIALRNGFAKVGTILLEPLMKLYIRVYKSETEKIIQDIINKRGKILYKDNKNSYKVEYNIGKAYFMLSKIRGNEESLSYAIESFDEALWCYFEALKINSIEKYPLNYDEINTKVGRTYMKLSRIHSHEENFLKAINCFEEALKVYGKEKCILDYSRLNEYINTVKSNNF